MPSTNERRGHPRVARSERLFVQVAACSGAPNLAGATLRASTADISASGLRLLLDQEVPVGCSLELWVKVEGRPGTFLLTGEVRWTQPTGRPGAHFVGVALAGGGSQDSQRWRELLTLALLEDSRDAGDA